MKLLSQNRFLPVGALVLITILAYAHTFKSSFHYDDHHLILSNKAIEDIADPLRAIAYNNARPVLMLSFAFNFHFGGRDVFGWRLVNIFLHIGVSLLAYFIAEFTVRLQAGKTSMGSENTAIHKAIPFAASLLFALHPINTSAVTYIASRSSVLCAFFYLLSFQLFLRAAYGGKAKARSEFNWPMYLGSLACFTLSLGTKEIGATLPVLLFLHQFLFLRKDRNIFRGEELFKYLPYLFILAGLLALRFMMAGAVLEKDPVFLRLFSRADYFITQIQVIARYYLLKLALPFQLVFYTDFSVQTGFPWDLKFWPSAVFLLSALYAAYRQIKARPLLAYGVFWLFIALLPTSSFIPIIHVAVEERLYLPGIGFSFFLAALLINSSTKRKKIVNGNLIGCLLLLFFFSLQAIQRNSAYLTEPRLWFDVMKKSPGLARPHYDYGVYLAENKKWGEAIASYKESLRINYRDSSSHNNLGGIYFRLGQMEKAVLHFREALKYDPGNADAHFNMGLWLLRSNDSEGALKEFMETVQYNPRHFMALNNLGEMLLGKRMLTEGEKYLLMALELEPGSPEISNNLGLVYAMTGRMDQAVNFYQKAIEGKPEFAQAHFNLGLGLADMGRYDSAIQHVRAAGQLDPGLKEKASWYIAKIEEAAGRAQSR
ncbi:MAG: tetratricopeptide repeat protein [Nitrospinae bacterium]|nr:tetratricopeptide repeat protein [Nitrospinota bacterium]